MSALAIPDPDVHQIAQDRLDGEDWAALESLTEKQRAFVLEYVIDLNATRAAQRAGYAGSKDGSDAAWGVRGSLMLRHPVISPLVRKLTAATADEMGYTREFILKRLEGVAEAATAEGQHATAASVYRTMAQLRGDMVERVQQDVRVLSVQLHNVDMEGLR